MFAGNDLEHARHIRKAGVEDLKSSFQTSKVEENTVVAKVHLMNKEDVPIEHMNSIPEDVLAALQISKEELSSQQYYFVITGNHRITAFKQLVADHADERWDFDFKVTCKLISASGRLVTHLYAGHDNEIRDRKVIHITYLM